MKKLIIISLALVMSISAYSQTSGFGIGATAGYNGINFSMKYWLTESSAIQASAGFTFWNYSGFHVTGDYLFHLWDWKVGQDQMKVYLGPGIGIGIYSGYQNNFSMSARATSGVGYYFHNIPLELFADVVPYLGLFGPWSGVNPDVDFYVGARWYF